MRKVKWDIVYIVSMVTDSGKNVIYLIDLSPR